MSMQISTNNALSKIDRPNVQPIMRRLNQSTTTKNTYIYADSGFIRKVFGLLWNRIMMTGYESFWHFIYCQRPRHRISHETLIYSLELNINNHIKVYALNNW